MERTAYPWMNDEVSLSFRMRDMEWAGRGARKVGWHLLAKLRYRFANMILARTTQFKVCKPDHSCLHRSLHAKLR
jgi:hypothetical protein